MWSDDNEPYAVMCSGCGCIFYTDKTDFEYDLCRWCDEERRGVQPVDYAQLLAKYRLANHFPSPPIEPCDEF